MVKRAKDTNKDADVELMQTIKIENIENDENVSSECDNADNNDIINNCHYLQRISKIIKEFDGNIDEAFGNDEAQQDHSESESDDDIFEEMGNITLQ